MKGSRVLSFLVPLCLLWASTASGSTPATRSSPRPEELPQLAELGRAIENWKRWFEDQVARPLSGTPPPDGKPLTDAPLVLRPATAASAAPPSPASRPPPSHTASR